MKKLLAKLILLNCFEFLGFSDFVVGWPTGVCRLLDVVLDELLGRGAFSELFSVVVVVDDAVLLLPFANPFSRVVGSSAID